jgi:NADPH-dependent glutamate synthase beta subunit-like oxidoreductase/dihydroorotate dehydrogenase/Pyruvate/2-oxoacid:ferredoxin oxidoreductase delta subunit
VTVRGPLFLSEAQLAAEVARCEYCAEKPCKTACPADCSPADFIMAVRVGESQDFRRAAGMIMAANPLGGVCGAVCPDTHCMAACARTTFDRPVEIPAVQAAIIARARALGVMPEFGRPSARGARVAVVGGGPAGAGAASVLAQAGCAVDVFERGGPGGMAGLIPPFRMDHDVLAADLAFVAALGTVNIERRSVADPATLLGQGYNAVVLASGLATALRLGIPGEDAAVGWTEFLARANDLAGKAVAVVGGGAVAADCAETAVAAGASLVEIYALESLAEMPLTPVERDGLLRAGVHVSGRTRVTEVLVRRGSVVGVATRKVALPAGQTFHPSRVRDIGGSDQRRPGFDAVVVAIGARAETRPVPRPGVFLAGDLLEGPTTVVEAVAAGKNAALEVLDYLGIRDSGFGARPDAIGQPPGQPLTNPEPRAPSPVRIKVKSFAILPGFRRLPVPLDAEFFGRPIASPFLLSAAPPTDGYDQMRAAYEAGWAGGVMKTAFDGVPIHIPARYMVAFDGQTFGNCDNVSGHALDRVCREVERLRREFPDRLTLASTGGPVTGHDELDRRGWQSNTRRLEAAGSCGIEYSLSCPQGDDGTRGDIVSQDAELTAKIVEWVLAAGDPAVPKLFKLTAAVTAIHPIIAAIRAVLDRHPSAAAGVTLANTFPTLAFRRGEKADWDEGIVVGMSGAGVTPISNLTLAKVAGLGVAVSGNGGPMEYRAAANFLALGARTVQFCSAVMKFGYGIVDELHSGLSHLLEARGLRSVEALIGRALPGPVTEFMALPSTKQISQVTAELCTHCGSCTRCPYLAIALDPEKVPRTDPARCVGCSFCTLMCFAGALAMRDRTPEEAAALVEG